METVSLRDFRVLKENNVVLKKFSLVQFGSAKVEPKTKPNLFDFFIYSVSSFQYFFQFGF